MIIETPRLRLRPLTDADMEPYLAMAADREVDVKITHANYFDAVRIGFRVITFSA